MNSRDLLIKKKAPPPPPSENIFQRHSLFLSVLFIGLFFLYIIFDSLSPHLPKYNTPPHLYSNQCQRDLRLTLLEAINQSKESIHLVMFGLSDGPILSAISQKAKQGIDVNIYYDPKGSPRIDLLLENAKIHPITSRGLMHQKILVIDHEVIFIGSANMTTASLRMHDNLMIGLVNRKTAQFLEEKTPHHSGYIKATVGGQELEVWLLPDPRGHALSDLRKKIRAAQRSIRIALFTYTHPPLIEEVIAAHRRGVEVSVIIDMHSGLGASAKGIQQMHKERVPIFISQGVQLMHHKFLWIDEKILLTGSANWTKSAFYKNSDCFVALHNLNAQQKTFMKKLWRQLKTEAKSLYTEEDMMDNHRKEAH